MAALPYASVNGNGTSGGPPLASAPVKSYLFTTLLFLGFSIGWVANSLLSPSSPDASTNADVKFDDDAVPIVTVMYKKVLDGECSQSGRHKELHMFVGDGDNGDPDNYYAPTDDQIKRCAMACDSKKEPVGGSSDDWLGFGLEGFIILSNGRCWCENTKVIFGECEGDAKEIENGYVRYDYIPLEKVMDGECGQEVGMELRMFEGNGDNGPPSGDLLDQQIVNCGNACLNNAVPLNADENVWQVFDLQGFIIQSGGRCYCEDTMVVDGQCVGENSDISLGYSRYNLILGESGAYYDAVKAVITTGLLYTNSSSKLSESMLSSSKTIHYLNEWYSGFDVQINQAYCGLSSVATLMNSLKTEIKRLGGPDHVDMPIDAMYAPYQYATQKDLLEGSCTHENVVFKNETYDSVMTFPYGTTLLQLSEVLECQLNGFLTRLPGNTERKADFKVEPFPINPVIHDLNWFRETVIEALEKGGQFKGSMRVLVNFRRSELGQRGGGHWSPIAAYNGDSDSVLILDTAKYKYSPTWIRMEKLFRAVSTVDRCGIWEWATNAQKLLTKEEREIYQDGNQGDETSARAKLECVESYRGIIRVEQLYHFV